MISVWVKPQQLRLVLLGVNIQISIFMSFDSFRLFYILTSLLTIYSPFVTRMLYNWHRACYQIDIQVVYQFDYSLGAIVVMIIW